ncbi:hypothetical protein [Melaminivora sp.]|uniref:hypothetical protein n=1 Tax=Melaminivora sp. TaxID=1933032 RepID=UPI0028A73AAA|nr:hypothetical protein [Melaminivora sp.]
MASEKDGLLGALGKGAAGAAGGALFLWFSGLLKPLWSWLHQTWLSLWTHLMAQSSWPNWLAYVISLAAALACLRWARRQWRSRKDSTWRFHQLSFLGVLWRWLPTSGLPSHVSGYCPACDTRLVYETLVPNFDHPRRIALHCETCSSVRLRMEGNLDYMNARVIREIDRLQRTGEWKQHVPD